MLINLFDSSEFDDVLVTFSIKTDFVKNDFNNNIFILKQTFILEDLSDSNNLIKYLKKNIELHIKPNKYIIKQINIYPENERIPF
jgi:hypothetical protein